jgi:hypothetical protein
LLPIIPTVQGRAFFTKYMQGEAKLGSRAPPPKIDDVTAASIVEGWRISFFFFNKANFIVKIGMKYLRRMNAKQRWTYRRYLAQTSQWS